MNSLESKVLTQVVGRITQAPKLIHTAARVPICRFVVATEAGISSNPVVMPIYVQGVAGAPRDTDLAIRCGRLLEGDLVRVRGEVRQRTLRRGRVEYSQVCTLAREVKLFGRLGDE
jgi:hypothetical protein